MTVSWCLVQRERENATAQLEQFAQTNFPNYILELSRELANEQQQVHLRAAAGLALKNTMTAREEIRLREYEERWLAIHPDLKQTIKSNVLGCMGSNESRASTAAAQVIAAISSIEIPRNQWPELMGTLLENVTSTSSTDILRQATLQCIGFICETISPEILESHSDRILTAVVQGARQDEPSQAVRLAALTALTNSLDFISKHFNNDTERNFIMQVVCEATTSPDLNVVAAAFECLVKIMSNFYDKMQLYMQQALFGLTINGMRSNEPRVNLQAIEFWSTVCEVEIDIMEEAAEAIEYGEKPLHTCFYFAKTALSEIVPVLLWRLTQQEEDADEDEWNPAMAAGTCLTLLASCVQNDVVGPVVQFVESHIRNQDWRFREAAVMAFGSILDGPESHVLQPIVSQALPVIIEMMQDSVELVKDTSAWTLGRICALHVSCINMQSDMLQNLVGSLLKGLEESPRVATNCAWALMNLSCSLGNEGNDIPSFPLSPFYEHIINGLLRSSERSDGSESNFRSAAYESLGQCMLHAASDCLPYVQKATLVILDRLDTSISMESQVVGQDDRTQLAELQMSLCGVVQNIARKLGKEILPLVDRIMVAFFRIFQSTSKTSTTVEDVFLAIGVIVNTLEGEFLRYMESFAPFLYGALQNPEEHQLCSTAVGIVSDLSRSLGSDILPYCNQFMQLLSQNLQSPVLNRDIKPQILACYGEIALGIMGGFEQYMSFTMTVLLQASQIQFDPQNDDMRYYAEDLFEGIFEAYTGIAQGLKAGEKSALLTAYVDQIFYALKRGLEIPEVDEKVVRAALGLLGDVASSVGPLIKAKLREDWIEQLFRIAKANRGYSPATKEVLKWARSIVKKVTV